MSILCKFITCNKKGEFIFQALKQQMGIHGDVNIFDTEFNWFTMETGKVSNNIS